LHRGATRVMDVRSGAGWASASKESGMPDMRRCIGSARYGIEGHEAPPGDFPAQPSQKDGLGRMCKPHWNQYTGALRKAAQARKAEGGEAPAATKAAGATVKPERARRSKIEHPMAHIPKASAKRPKEPRQPKPPKPESPRVRKAREMVAATESLEGRAYTDAVGSDEVQAALGVLGGDGHDDTFEQDVRAILAGA